MKKNVRLIAHRGFTPAAPQNSLAAFREAGKRNFWAIETDVRRTVDGYLVCIHDAMVDNTYEMSGFVNEMTLSELQKLQRRERDSIYIKENGKESCWSEEDLKIPLFSEYLKICRSEGAVPFIETKTSDIQQVLEEVSLLFKENEFVISSVNFAHLEKVRKLTQQVFIHHIFSADEYLKKLTKMGNAGLSYNYPKLEQVPEGLIEYTHKQGVCVCLRAADDLRSVHQMEKMKLDYIPTNLMEPKLCE